MAIKTIYYKRECPKCGSTKTKSIVHFDGVVTGISHVCAECGAKYNVSLTYDTDSSAGSLIESFEKFNTNDFNKLFKDECVEKEWKKSMNVKDYLIDKKENVPEWLNNYKLGDKLDFNEILYKHRLVYYPGAYIDGQGVRTFNQCHYAHTFLYVDYGPSKEETREHLCENEAFKGYKLLDLREVSAKDLGGTHFVPHFTPNQEQISWVKGWAKHAPYCYLAIYERLPEYSDEHGASRFALLYLYADGIATYDALFANHNKAPEVIIIEDHGFGGNYDMFGNDGALRKIAKATNTFPHYMMVMHELNWEEYNIVSGLNPEIGGMHRSVRFLYAHRSYKELGKQREVDVEALKKLKIPYKK